MSDILADVLERIEARKVKREEDVICDDCGGKVPEDSLFCPYCGIEFEEESEEDEEEEDEEGEEE